MNVPCGRKACSAIDRLRRGPASDPPLEAKVGSDEIHLHDRVVNHGFYRTPHMYCYHINVGHPVLAEGSRYVAPIRDVVWAAHADDYQKQGVGYRTLSGPKMNFHEQVWQHDMQPDATGKVNVALVNENIGFCFEVEVLKEQFPTMYEWQNLQAGHYALGIEPSSNHVFGKPFAKERGELIWLEHGDERRYDSVFRILPEAPPWLMPSAASRPWRSSRRQEYPAPSGNFLPIEGARMQNRTILYTGAAGGLGLQTTLNFLARGATVVAVDHDDAKIAALTTAAAGIPTGRLLVTRSDMSDLESFRAAIRARCEETGGYDVVINNAAIYPSKYL